MPNRAALPNRVELMESVLDSYPEGIALVGIDGQVLFWNHAAESITGFTGIEVVARAVPDALEPILAEPAHQEGSSGDANAHPLRGSIVHAQHRHGDALCTSARTLILRDGLGERIGKAVFFHPAESQDALLRGDVGEGLEPIGSMERLEERMEELFKDFKERNVPLSLLWITVDQAHVLRHTHGLRACEAMLERVERTLANGLRPQEELGRWGDDEFLILSHERRPQALAAFAQHIAGLTRTTDFRWWGDRISLTVSVGAALAEPDETLPLLLERAKSAMLASVHAGGNHMTLAPKRFPGEPAAESPTFIRQSAEGAQGAMPAANPASNSRQESTPPALETRRESCSQS
ncbi:MAG TPA: diguanylate cyclase [Terracidiphilus sp.]|nr:diguanylate cyclase [Terracidiphilus sp.]